MIQYIADFCGIDVSMLESPFGVMICTAFLAVFVYGLLKVILHWLDFFLNSR